MLEFKKTIFTLGAFKAFEGLSAKVATVSINPNEATEKDLLSDLKVESTSVATTVLLAPPGMAIARFEGKFTQQEVSEALAQASSGGCAAGQCGPGSAVREPSAAPNSISSDSASTFDNKGLATR